MFPIFDSFFAIINVGDVSFGQTVVQKVYHPYIQPDGHLFAGKLDSFILFEKKPTDPYLYVYNILVHLPKAV